MEYFGIVAIVSLALYFMAPTIIADLPSFAYCMTWPLRIALPIGTYHTYGSVEGLLIGAGLAFIFSFEHGICWKIGAVLVFSSALC